MMISRPLVISVGMHALFAVLAVFGLPMLGRDLPEEMPIVRLEVVRTVPETNLIEGDKPSTAKEEQKATVSKKPPPPPPPRAASSKPAPPPPPPKPEPAAPAKVEAAEILPDKPKPKPKVDLPKPKPKKTEVAQVSPKPKPKPKAETKPKAKPSPSVLPTPKPARRPERKPAAPTAKPAKANDAVANQLNKLVKDQKKREQAASGVLQNLAEAQLAAKDAEKARKTQERKVAADTVTKTLSAVAGNAVKAPEKKSLSPVGIDDIARIQQHVSKCWQPPLGAAGNDTLKVDIFVAVNELGEVRRAEIEDKLRFNLDSYFKASAIAARRAIVECSPLPIPPEKFDQLKEFTFSFDPAFLSR
ncbi:MAG: hypothetical protein VX108_02000 [Pseudomonadota bacterium]|nr:hypothetical protein [Pseudomonadota bacterium]MEC8091342.1 hypothetical protein [Pseudomonadota bacterium]